MFNTLYMAPTRKINQVQTHTHTHTSYDDTPAQTPAHPSAHSHTEMARAPSRSASSESALSTGLLQSGIRFIRESVSGVFSAAGGRNAANTAPLVANDINTAGFNNRQKNFLVHHRDAFRGLHQRAVLLQGNRDAAPDEVRSLLREIRVAIETAQPQYDNLIAELHLAGKTRAVTFATSLWTQALAPIADVLTQASNDPTEPADPFRSANMASSGAADASAPAGATTNSATTVPPPPPHQQLLPPQNLALPPRRHSTPDPSVELAIEAEGNGDALSPVPNPVEAERARFNGPTVVHNLQVDESDTDAIQIVAERPPPPPPPPPPPAVADAVDTEQQRQIAHDHQVALQIAAQDQNPDMQPTISKDDLIQRQMQAIKDLERRLDAALAQAPANNQNNQPPPAKQHKSHQTQNRAARGPGTQHYNTYHYNKSSSPRSRLRRPPSPNRRNTQQQQGNPQPKQPQPLFPQLHPQPTDAEGHHQQPQQAAAPGSTHSAPPSIAGDQGAAATVGAATGGGTLHPGPRFSGPTMTHFPQANNPLPQYQAAPQQYMPQPPPNFTPNPILQRYHAQLMLSTAPPASSYPNPFQYATTDEPASYYLSLTHPWNVTPPNTAIPATDYDKFKKMAPPFNGKPDSYVVWRQIFIPSVHLARASVNWKVSALLACFNMSDPELRHIADGIPADSGGYRLAIRRLEKHYGHPLGVLGARQRALDAITKVTRPDTKLIHRLYLKLEDLINEYERVNRAAEAFGPHLYENVTQKLDPDLLADFHLWNSAVAKHPVPCAVTILAWLDELLDVRRATALPPRAASVPPPNAQVFSTNGPVKFVCPFDQQEHRIIKCPQFQGETPNNRRRMLQRVRRCFSCFEEGHDTSTCPRNISCKECGNKHHSLLHGAKFFKKKPTIRAHTTQVETDSDTEEEEEPFTQTAYHVGIKSRVSLQTVPVTCVNPLNGKTALLNCMLDSGATASFISQKAAEELGLQGRAAMATIKGFNGSSFEQEIMVSHLVLKTHNTDHEVSVQVVRDPAASYKPFDWTQVQHLHSHLKDLPIPQPVPGRVVDVMLGQATPHLLSAVSPDVAPPTPGGPIARHTALGWTVGGPTGLSPTDSDESSLYVLKCHAPAVPVPWSAARWSSFHFTTKQDNTSNATEPPPHPKNTGGAHQDRNLHDLVQRMFDVDAAAGPLANSVRDEQVFAYLRKNMIMEDGRYKLPVLWKTRPPPFTTISLTHSPASAAWRIPSSSPTPPSAINIWGRSTNGWRASSWRKFLPPLLPTTALTTSPTSASTTHTSRPPNSGRSWTPRPSQAERPHSTIMFTKVPNWSQSSSQFSSASDATQSL